MILISYIVGALQWDLTAGWCLDCSGADQNDGSTMFHGLNEAQCVQKCSEDKDIKGCEHSGTTCVVHLNDVSGGSGVNGYKCWGRPSNCPGKVFGRVSSNIIF